MRKSSGETASVEEKIKLLMVGLASLKNAERPWPFDCSKSEPGRRDMSSPLRTPFSTKVIFWPRTPCSSTVYPPTSRLPLNSFAPGSSTSVTLGAKTRVLMRPTQSLFPPSPVSICSSTGLKDMGGLAPLIAGLNTCASSDAAARASNSTGPV